MGTCCSKIDKHNAISSFRGALHPSWEQLQAAQSSCQFCQVNELAGHLQCCMCETCQRAVSYGTTKGFGEGRSCREAMCSLCAADVYDAHFHQQSPYLNSQPSTSGAVSDDEDGDAIPYDLGQSQDHSLEQSYSLAGRYVAMPVHSVHGHKQDLVRENREFECDCLAIDGRSCNNEDEMQHFWILPTSKKEDQDALLSSVAVCDADIVGNSRRLSNIDDSDGIKLEVRYKHMLPHDAHIVTASPHDANVLKRARSQDEQLLGGDPEASRSIRRRKSFQITDLDEEDALLEYSLCSLDSEDELDNDDDFHDITVGVSIGSLEHENSQFCEVPALRDMQVQERLQCIPDCVAFTKSDSTEMGQQPVYVMSQENMQFITREERANCMSRDQEDKICSKMQALSVVSTGDAILFAGSNSDEFHLIPSVAIQQSKSSFSSPKQKLGPIRIVSPERHVHQDGDKPPLSVDDIIHLLEIDELNEDDLFSLLIDSCAKSSASSSPSASSTETSNSWSSSLSSSTSSSSSSKQVLSPLSSTSVLQLPPSPTTYCSTLPYSLSLPPSCKMSPHSSFEFKVKSCGSTPSTPTFSPMRSRSKRNVSHLKQSALSTEEIAQIWGVFEQRQAFVSKNCIQK